ncbi:MAG: hypothetical protein ACRDYF_18315 [Acidimicrobiia bacterium]
MSTAAIRGLMEDGEPHDIFIALDGQAVRMKYRPGTARSEALQALRRQVALARL